MRGGIFLSTNQVEPGLRNEFWRSVSQPLFDVFPTEVDGQLQGSVMARPIGGLTIVLASFNRQQQVRSRQIIARGGLDHYLLHLVIAGTMKANCEHIGIEARPGDLCVLDLTQPYVLHAEACERITLAIPRERIDLASGGRRFHGVLLRSGRPLTQLLRNLVLNLHRTIGEIGQDDAAAIEVATIDYIAAVITNGVWDSTLDVAPERNLRRRMLSFIDANLGEPALGIEALMRQFQISRAHLYRAFVIDGGVATAIRDRRLDRAYHRLRDKGQSGSLTEMAYELGFTSSGQFSRAFKNRFGISPREVKMDPYLENPVDKGPPILHSHFTRLADYWSVKREGDMFPCSAGRSDAHHTEPWVPGGVQRPKGIGFTSAIVED
jgi:AraC-like DNA-binding protein